MLYNIVMCFAKGVYMPNNNDNIERVILVAIATGDEDKCLRSLDELSDLAETAGAVTLF